LGRLPRRLTDCVTERRSFAAMMEPVQAQLNARDIDTVRLQLVGLLDAEHDALLRDAEYLQLCLEEETDAQCGDDALLAVGDAKSSLGDTKSSLGDT
jgi:hypothetical protein